MKATEIQKTHLHQCTTLPAATNAFWEYFSYTPFLILKLEFTVFKTQSFVSISAQSPRFCELSPVLGWALAKVSYLWDIHAPVFNLHPYPCAAVCRNHAVRLQLIRQKADPPERMHSDGGKPSSQGAGPTTFCILTDSHSGSLGKP